MADLSAHFVANFSSFYDAVDKATIKLRDIEKSAATAGPALSRMVDNFSGRKMLEEAAAMERAITEIGGVSKLTQKELAAVSSKAAEAVEKMKALGRDVPPGLQDIANAAKPATESMGELNLSFASIAKTVGIGFGLKEGIQFAINFGKEILGAADALMKLHDKTGISLQGLQRFQVAGDDAGNSIDELTGSVTKMMDKLASGDKGAMKALDDLKIPFEDIKNLNPENQFIAISDAIRQVQNPAEQVRLAIDLFGKSGADILPTLKRGFDDLKGSTVGMSDDTIENLDLVGDTMSRWYRTTKGVLANATVEFGRFVADGMDPATHAMNNAMREADALNRELERMAKAIPAAAKAAPAQLPKISIDSDAVKGAAADLREANAKIDKANEDTRKEAEKAQKAIDDYNKSLQDIGDTLSGGQVIDKALKYLTALRDTVPIANMTRGAQDALNKIMGDALDAYQALGTEAPKAMQDIWLATQKPISEIDDLNQAIKTLGKESAPIFANLLQPLKEIDITKAAGQIGLEAGPALGNQLKSSLKGTIADIPNLIIDTMKGGGSLSSAVIALGTQIGQDFSDALAERIKKQKLSGAGGSVFTGTNVAMGGASGAMAGVGAMAGGASVGQSIGAAAGMGMSVAVMGGMTTGAIALGAATFGIGTAAVFAYYGIRKLIQSAKDRKETNKLREDFIDLGGGLEAVNEQAWKAGASLDALLAAKSPEQAKAALEALQASFEFQKAAIDDVNATAQKYGFTLEELGPALQRQALDQQAQDLFHDFEVLNAAGIDSVAIMTRMGAATSDYINTAIKMGSEVPEAMKPMLEDMVKAGTLTDANGDAITDLESAGVKFSLTMTEGFKQMIASVDKLAEVISRSLGVALDETNSKIKSIPKSVDVEVNYKQKTSGNAPAAEEIEGFQSGTDGYRNFGKGTPVMLHGWEAVVPRESESQAGGALDSGGGVQIVINAQGAFFDTPESQQRLADKVAAALTARHALSNKSRAA